MSTGDAHLGQARYDLDVWLDGTGGEELLMQPPYELRE